MNRLSCDVLVLGAGAVGLSAARHLPQRWNRILVETHPSFGREASSRNSEVIHSGIYYPPDSLKTKWCREGRAQLYLYCAEQGVDFRKIGKLLIATETSELGALEARVTHARACGVPADIWTSAQVSAREPEVRAVAAGFFPESGIVDSHSFLAAMEEEFLASGGTLAYGHKLLSIESHESRWRAVASTGRETFEIDAGVVINAAGLSAARISNQALATDRFQHKPCRGRYLSLSPRWKGKFRGLVYPMPQNDGLGVHVTLDLTGAARLGPDVDWWEGPDSDLYKVEWEKLEAPFLEAGRRYLPALEREDLGPGLVGVRPKLFVEGQAHPDFLVEARHGFVHCLGIESPGLTAALPIGAEAARLACEALG